MVLCEATMLGEMSLRAFVIEVKARRPDTARPMRMNQSDQLILMTSVERMRESDCSWENMTAMISPDIADQLTRMGAETQSHLAISTSIRPPVQQAVTARDTPT